VIDAALDELLERRRLLAGAPLVLAAGIGSRTPNIIALRELAAE
jgi:hypothetical protein